MTSSNVGAGEARAALTVVYLSGLVQGVALVVFPAAGNLLQSPTAHGLTDSQYGSLFLAMFGCAVLAAGLAQRVVARFGLYALYGASAVANAVSMGGLAATQVWLGVPGAAFPGVLASICALGFGFGGELAALNVAAAALAPQRTALAITGLHTLLGVGTALPPVLLRGAQSIGAWWLLPLGTCVAVLLLLAAFVASPTLRHLAAPLEAPSASRESVGRSHFGAALAVSALYGLCEASLSNWGAVFLHHERGLSEASAGAALSAFWVAVTLGRLLGAAATRWLSPQTIYRGLPLAIAVSVSALALSPRGAALWFALAGLSCSAFLPLTFALSPPSRAGVLLACFLTGSGAGSFGLGLLHDRGVTLSRLYVVVALAALCAAGAQRIYMGASAGAKASARNHLKAAS